MAFRFTEEDFRRYVKKSEHGGVHIWDELMDRLAGRYKVPFEVVAYKTRGDWLQLFWLSPKDSPRGSWKHQAKFFLTRITKPPQLMAGIHVQRPEASYFSPEGARKEGWNPDCDGIRFLRNLAEDPDFQTELARLLSRPAWRARLRSWTEQLKYMGRDLGELRSALDGMPPDEGIDLFIERVFSSDEAIQAGEGVADELFEAYEALLPLWEAILPAEDLRYLRETQVSRSGRPTQPTRAQSNPPRAALPIDALGLIRRSLRSEGLHFTDWQVATFYTALQTKGFVILSGISGTGKTKLAQAFAAMLPGSRTGTDPGAATDRITVTVQPYMVKYSRIIIPKRATRLFEPPPPGETREVMVRFDGQSQLCRLTYSVYPGTNYIALFLRGEARRWFQDTFQTADMLVITPELDEEGNLEGFLLADEQGVSPGPGGVGGGHNHLFVPVRTDWRDSKSLLGYYNPLTGTYEWTQFLRFLLRAVRSYQDQDGLAWFIILDEMNLARVEYYFADLLSVLESGRRPDGWTREPLRAAYPEDAEGDLPPAEVYLPPNLYVVGTVNVDETTHAFSPKVLDRAFTLELTEADFTDYPASVSRQHREMADDERQALLDGFSFNGRFSRVEKESIVDHVGRHPQTRERLQVLNKLLQPYDLHFGYRVFDEITMFLIAAEQNGTYRQLGGLEAALDAAVLMKVLPKFHGSRGRLEAPLRALLAWCASPDSPDREAIANALEPAQADTVRSELDKLVYHYPKTAERAGRMLWALYTSGFAAFG